MLFCWVFISLLLVTRADAQVSTVVSPVPPGTNFNVFVFGAALVSVTDGTTDVPFTTIYDVPGGQVIEQFQLTVPAETLTNSITLMGTNFATNVPVVTHPYFFTALTNQAVFLGSKVTFSSPALHTSGYQWQHSGTNLMDDGHFAGATTSILVISKAQLADVGSYLAIASHPLNPATNGAALSVYKPMALGLSVNHSAGGFTLTIANQDGSPFEPERIPNLQIFSTADLGPDSASWDIETNTGAISNGVLQFNCPNAGSTDKFWRVQEQEP
jgi:hypothetical protein